VRRQKNVYNIYTGGALFQKLFLHGCTKKATKVEPLAGYHSNGGLLALPANIRLGWKKLADNKQLSLLCHNISEEAEKCL
jgi:hypothetical protein